MRRSEWGNDKYRTQSASATTSATRSFERKLKGGVHLRPGGHRGKREPDSSGLESLRMTTREEGGHRVSAAYEPTPPRLRDPPPPLHRTCWCGTSIQAQLVCDSLQGFDAERDVIFEVDAQISCAIYDVLAFDVAREGFVFHLFTN